jgi:hypothetical protein
MGKIHETLEPVPFAEPEPYGGGRYLKAPGEIDFCDFFNFDFDAITQGTEVIDSDGDGRRDCFRPVTTTEPGGDGGGDDGGGRGGGRGGGDDQPQPTLPGPTFTLPTFRPDG